MDDDGPVIETKSLRLGALFEGHAAKEAARDRLRPSERVGQLIGMVVALIVAVYFAVLYASSSGFFTSEFTTADAVLFFEIAFLGAIPGLLRVVIGHKNAIRPLDVIFSISMLVAAAWFLSSFPFDFSHLPDALPMALRFLLSWISDGIAQVLMAIAIIASIFMIPYTTLLYLAVRRKLTGSTKG
jgi:hypothetical protein